MNSSDPIEPVLLTIPEAAALTRIGRTLAFRLAASGAWPVVRIGRCVRIPLKALREWTEKQTMEVNE